MSLNQKLLSLLMICLFQCLVCVNYAYWHHTPLPQDGYPLYVKDIYFIGTPPAIKKSQGILRFLKQETLKVCTCTCYHCIRMFEYLYWIQLTYTVHCVIVYVFSHVFNFLYIRTHTGKTNYPLGTVTVLWPCLPPPLSGWHLHTWQRTYLSVLFD